MQRLKMTVIVGVALAFVTASFAGGSGDYKWVPKKNITIRVPFAAGGAFDTAARIVGQGLQKTYGRTVIVKNVVGAAGSMAAMDLATVPPAGTEMMGGAIGMFTMKPLFDPNFSMSLDDFEIVSGMISEDFILCVNVEKSGIKSWQDLLKFGTNKRIICATNIPGGATHMLATGLFGEAGLNFDVLTATGSNKNMLQLLAGDSICTIVPASVAAANITEGGNIVPILVFSNEPFSDFSGYSVPTVKSIGYDIVFRSSNFLMTRKGVPESQIDSLHTAIADFYETDDFRVLADQAHMVPDSSTGEEIKNTVASAADLCKSIFDKYYAK